jgi:hypothetical protein
METNTKTPKNTESQSIYDFLEKLIEENKNKKDIIILPHDASSHDFEKIMEYNGKSKKKN